jgi:hypothetical protein
MIVRVREVFSFGSPAIMQLYAASKRVFMNLIDILCYYNYKGLRFTVGWLQNYSSVKSRAKAQL